MRAASGAARYSVEESDSFLRITIHPRGYDRRTVTMLLAIGVMILFFFTFLLCLLIAAGGSRTVTAGVVPRLVGLLAAVGWIGCVLWELYKVAWELAGRERVTVTADTLLQTLSLGSLVRTRRYALADVTRLCVPLEFGAWWAERQSRFRRGPRGMIQFEFQGRRKRLGIGLRVAEAQAILALLEPRVARH